MSTMKDQANELTLSDVKALVEEQHNKLMRALAQGKGNDPAIILSHLIATAVEGVFESGGYDTEEGWSLPDETKNKLADEVATAGSRDDLGVVHVSLMLLYAIEALALYLVTSTYTSFGDREPTKAEHKRRTINVATAVSGIICSYLVVDDDDGEAQPADGDVDGLDVSDK